MSAELAAENKADELPESEVDDETVELSEAKAGVQVGDGTNDSEIDGPTQGHQ